MNKQELKNIISQGDLIDCNEDDYKNYIRNYIQDIAGEFIDQNDHVKGIVALEEVKRLDNKFDYSI